MELLRISDAQEQSKTSIYVTEDSFHIEGDYYYLINKEFCKAISAQDSRPVKEYLGLGSLRKRSPKRLIRFCLIAAVLEFVDMVAGKINDYLFFMDTDWTSYVVNTVAVLCVIQGLRLFFSKKKVHEISFLTKRFCVNEKDFSKEDMKKLDAVLLKLR